MSIVLMTALEVLALCAWPLFPLRSSSFLLASKSEFRVPGMMEHPWHPQAAVRQRVRMLLNRDGEGTDDWGARQQSSFNLTVFVLPMLRSAVR